MHCRRYHSQQRRRFPCATEPLARPEGGVSPPGSYIDLSDPREPKLAGDLPAEFKEFGGFLCNGLPMRLKSATRLRLSRARAQPPPLQKPPGEASQQGRGT